MNPVAALTVREAIRIRPLGIGVLEDLSGGAFWSRLDATVEELCRETGVDPAQVQHRFAALPENLDRQDWTELPLYSLVDHLTAEHRQFRSRELPGIDQLLQALRLKVPSAQAALDALVGDYRAFRQEFDWHMQEEEEFLFPKFLRTEASLRHPDLYPEVFKGSLGMFSGRQWHSPEDRFHMLISDLRGRLRTLVSGVVDASAAREALAALQGYEARLRAHAYLEGEILFPEALQMEAVLLQRTGEGIG